MAVCNYVFKRPEEGFTLIEVAMATCLVAILAILATPAYQQYSMRAYRSEAVNALVRLAACQETIRVSSGKYDLGQCSVSPPGAYRLEMTQKPDGLGYQLTAHPTGRQSQDKCGSLVLDSLGERSISAESQSSANCWASR